jgi:autotransporter-associated beta strand protein
VNSGTISGGANGDGSGIALGASFSGNSNSLVNLGSGVINGGVSMTGSNNSVTLFTGSVISGALNMGADTQSLLTLDGAGTSLFSSAITGATTFAGGLTKQGAGTWTLDRTLNASSVTVNGGTLRLSAANATTASNNIAVNNGGTLTFGVNDTWGNANTLTSAAITVNAGGTLASGGFFNTLWNPTLNGGTILLNGGVNSTFPAFSIAGTLTATGSSSVVTGSGANNAIVIGGSGNPTLTIATPGATDSLTINAPLQNRAANATGLNKTGAGTLTLNAANTYTGTTTVSAGTLELANASGSALGSTASLNVASGATLLVSQSNQVNNNAAVTLSGGTITRGSGVSEVFGSLNLTEASFLDFGTGTVGTISFGTYTPSSLLTINNFGLGNTLVFGSDLRSTINNSSFFTFTNGGIGSSSWNQSTSTFTITAIPEPSTYVAALGLLALMLWPLRRRLRGKVS